MALKMKSLIMCIGTVLLLCFAQIRGSSMLILGVAGLFLLLLGWEMFHEHGLPILLFFLPWSTLMRMQAGGFSFYTIGLCVACLITLVKTRFAMRQKDIITGLLFVIMTVMAKLLNESSLDTSYIAFVMLLVMVPTLRKQDNQGAYDFNAANVFFAVGIILAAFCAQRFQGYSNISNFIRIDSYSNITRMCGFYSDPNFYAAQISSSLAGTFLSILRGRGKQIPVAMVLSVLLLYCGLLSGSKSFAIVLLCMMVIWVVLLFKVDRKPSFKLGIICMVIVVGAVILSSQTFQALFQVLINRFSGSSGLSGLTTGRTDIWMSYLHEMTNDPLSLLLGKGFTAVLVNGQASHNTVLQVIYQFGILATPLIIKWWLDMGDRQLLVPVSRQHKLVEMALLAVGFFLPWMALDMLFFDEFFLMHWFFLLGLEELVQVEEKPVSVAGQTENR